MGFTPVYFRSGPRKGSTGQVFGPGSAIYDRFLPSGGGPARYHVYDLVVDPDISGLVAEYRGVEDSWPK